MSTRIQKRRGTAAAWTSANPVLAAGEEGWETDTHKGKTGDGSTAWVDLDYDVVPDVLGTFASLTPDVPTALAHGQEVSDGVFTLAVLDTGGLGNYEMAFLREMDPPDAFGASDQAAGGAELVALRLSGSPANTGSGDLFASARVTVLDLSDYNDAAVTNPHATAHEIDISIQGVTSIKHLRGNYSVPIAGADAPSGTITELILVGSSSWQFDADVAGLTIANMYGATFDRPYRTGAHVTVTNQRSLYAEEGQVLETSSAGGASTALGLKDRDTSTWKYLRVNNGALEFINSAFSAVIASLGDDGTLTLQGGLAFDAFTDTSAPSAGAAGAIPATPDHWMYVTVNGAAVKWPTWNA